MKCYFLCNGHLAGVEVLPLGLSDEGAIAKAHAQSAKRKGIFDGLEVWDGARCVFMLQGHRRVNAGDLNCRSFYLI